MKKNVFKTIVAAVCVVAAGMGGMKAHNATNQSMTDMLLTENVEALGARESIISVSFCNYFPSQFCVIDVLSDGRVVILYDYLDSF